MHLIETVFQLMSIYSIYKCTTVGNSSAASAGSKSTLRDITEIRAELLKDERREDDQMDRIENIGKKLGTYVRANVSNQ